MKSKMTLRLLKVKPEMLMLIFPKRSFIKAGQGLDSCSLYLLFLAKIISSPGNR